MRLDAVLGAVPAHSDLGDLMRYTISPWLGRLLWKPMAKLLFAPSQITDIVPRLSGVDVAAAADAARAGRPRCRSRSPPRRA